MKLHRRPVLRLLLGRVRLFAVSWVLLALVVNPPLGAADTPAEDLLAKAFDETTGVPFASIMLGIIKTGAHSQQDPEVLDARLQAVEKALASLTARFQLLDQRLSKLENEVAHNENVQRLRKLQQVASDLGQITSDLRRKPTNSAVLGNLESNARRQATLIKDDPDLDIWKMSDVTANGIRKRFFVYPAFEVYVLALTTWFSTIETIETNAAVSPQQVSSGFGPALRAHQAFLEVRPTFHDQVDTPATLLENLQTAAFCRLEAVDKFANQAGACVFASVCINTMTEKSVETGRSTFTMQPPTVGTLCTSSPSQSIGLKGEDELRNRYGSELMTELAHSLNRVATTGSLREGFIGQFPNFISSQLFSVPFDAPLLAGAGASPGALPAIPRCVLIIGGCSFGVKLSEQTGWTIAHKNPSVPGGASGLNVVRHNGSKLCLDVKGGVAKPARDVILWSCNQTASQVWNFVKMRDNVHFTLMSGNSGLCATVASPPKGPFITESHPLALQVCRSTPSQQFGTTDSTLIGPH